MCKNILITVFSLFMLVGLSVEAHAVPLDIIGSPQHSGSGFRYNVFHTSTNGGGAGSILAWFDLDQTATNVYDPDSGDISAVFNIYNNSSFSTLWGSVTAIGNLPVANFGVPPSNDVAGSITYDFSFITSNNLSTYLGLDTSIDVIYRDKVYTTTQGRDVNGWEDSYLSLWGAGQIDGSTTTKYLGTDLVVQTGGSAVPEPASMLLFSTGLAGAFIRKRFAAQFN